jgi:ribonuclease HI
MSSQKVKTWVDGAVMNNGNKNGSGVANGGVGVVVITADSTIKKKVSFCGSTDSSEPGAVTNNRMELEAVLEVMKMRLQCKFICSHLDIHSDSAYVVNGWNTHIIKWVQKEWKTSENQPVKNQDLWKRMLEMRKKFINIECTFNLIKVAGHSGNKYNELADELAVSASQQSQRSNQRVEIENNSLSGEVSTDKKKYCTVTKKNIRTER